ncbi:MAG: PepSY domain-containing protein [Devosia sp.]
MWRSLHSVLALASLVLVLMISLSGAFLAAGPVVEAFSPAVQQSGDLSVAQVVGVLAQHFDAPDRLDRLPSGAVVLTAIGKTGPERHLVDIRRGTSLGLQNDDPVTMWVRELHRSFFVGMNGRLAAGGTALIMTLLCATGFLLLLRRQGGWRGLFGAVQGRVFERLHAISGRLCLLPLLFMALTGFYLTLVTFAVIPNGQETPPAIPESVAELDPVAPGTLHGLRDIPFASIKSVIYPIAGDWFDAFSVTTGSDHVFIDQFTGDVLSQQPLRPGQIGLEWIKALHTGEGMAPLAAVLGLSALSVPVFAFSGIAVWLGGRRRAGARSRGNVAATLADIVVLVGSENGASWGFARHLAEQLAALGRKVHLDALGSFAEYPEANAVLVLTSTYGDGDAPKSAAGCLAAVRRLRYRPKWSFAVLGFGDMSFANYCGFAGDADAALAERAERLLPLGRVDRESAQSFRRWGDELGSALGLDLRLDYVPPRPPTQRAVLVERTDYGAATGTATAVLVFDAGSGPRLPRCRAGDLVGVVPPGSRVPRYYSPAVGRADGRLEICVRLIAGGEGSGLLHGLAMGDSVDLFMRANPAFHAPKRPLILVAAGTGISPFAGMIRANNRRRDVRLYWGGRDPASDFLYRDEIESWLAYGRLASFASSFSRVGECAYVQDRVAEDAAVLVAQIQAGAAVMVCGSTEMAAGVRTTFDAMLVGHGLNVATLKARRRYLEEIY